MLLFAAVVREGGFSAAARTLGLTKQSVSQRVARLEAELGVRLLERTTRRVRTTDAGAVYYEQCAAIEALVREANETARQLQQEPIGRLRISAPSLLARRVLSPVVTRLLRRHPGVRVELLLADRRVDLVGEGFDLAVRVGDIDDPSLVTRRLGEASTAFVASPALLQGRPAPTVEDLSRWPWVGMRDPEGWTVGERRVRLAPVLVVNDLELVCSAAIEGIGLARLPLLVCADALRDGRLQRVLSEVEGPRDPIHAVFPSRKYLPARVRLFVDLLIEHLQGSGGERL